MNDNINERVKILIKQAIKEGIGAETVANYLKLTNIPVGEHKEIMDRLYQENGVYPWDMAFFRDIDSIIENLDKEEFCIVDETENREEKALLPVEPENIFSKLGTLFSNMWKSIKEYVKEMQVVEVYTEEIHTTEECAEVEIPDVA